MKTYDEGHTSKGFCSNCGGVVLTTIKSRDVPFSDSSGVVTGILVRVCNCCDQTVSIPAQSIEAIKEARSNLLKEA